MALSRELKVGLFVFLGLAGAGLIVFLIGDSRRMFDSKVSFAAHFEEVEGLKRGSTVRMGGVDIGTVSRVRYPDDLERGRIEVGLDIVSREARRIRADSRVGIAPKGLLGDKMVTVTPGNLDLPPLEPGSVLTSDAPEDITAILGKLQGLSTSAEEVLKNLESATSVLGEQEFQQNLGETVAALREVLHAINAGDGYVAKLLHDKEESQRISSLVGSADATLRGAASVMESVERSVERVRTGPGLAHELVYGESGAQALASVSDAASSFSDAVRGVREGSGMARALLFGDGPNQGEVADDIAAVSSDVAAMVRDVRQGKGTLGALLVDPSVYEDLKMLLGNIQRNSALRALVRYSIRSDEVKPVEVKDPERGEGESASNSQPPP